MNQLPSNKKFGLFFTGVFLCATLYLYFLEPLAWYWSSSLSVAILFGIFTFIKPNFLKPLNIAWFKLGLLLGAVVSPLVLGIIFFGLITPVALVARIFGRDELKMKSRQLKTYWIAREDSIEPNSFKDQF